MPDFNGRKRFNVEAWVEFAKLPQQFEIPFARQRRMKPAHHVHFRNSTAERAARRLNNLRDRNFESMRIALPGAKGAELAGQNADVRIIDITVENVGGTIPVLSLADDVGDQTERVDVSGPVQLNRFLVVDPLCRNDLIVNRAQRRWNETCTCEI